MSAREKECRTLSGTVIRTKMNKTIAVEIERVVPHPLYGKYIRRTETLLAHDEENKSREGDTIIVSACRPISKQKVWKLETIVNRQK